MIDPEDTQEKQLRRARARMDEGGGRQLEEGETLDDVVEDRPADRHGWPSSALTSDDIPEAKP